MEKQRRFGFGRYALVIGMAAGFAFLALTIEPKDKPC
jgi:hypothetical protein